MRKFKQGQTVYFIVVCQNYLDFRYAVERAVVTNDPIPQPHQKPVFNGKISREYLNWLNPKWHKYITRSRRVATRRCRILNQCNGSLS